MQRQRILELSEIDTELSENVNMITHVYADYTCQIILHINLNNSTTVCVRTVTVHEHSPTRHDPRIAIGVIPLHPSSPSLLSPLLTL